MIMRWPPRMVHQLPVAVLASPTRHPTNFRAYMVSAAEIETPKHDPIGVSLNYRIGVRYVSRAFPRTRRGRAADLGHLSSVMTTFHRPISELGTRTGLRQGSRQESRAEGVEQRVLSILRQTPLSRSEISIGLGHKSISGRLNEAIRLLMDDKLIEYTIPKKPNSRLQKYRLTEAGKCRLSESEKGRS